MKHNQYHLTALGNALVDLEFQVSSEFFKKQEIEKGVMTLIEKDRHVSLFTELQQKYELRKQACGGSAANTIVTAANFGASTFYCCKVGSDEFGNFYCHDLQKAGVEHALSDCNHDGETGKCIVMLTEDADRTMNTFLGVTSTLDKQQVVEEAIIRSEYFYIEGHLMYSEQAVEAILHAKAIAKKNDVKVALTVSDPAIVKYARQNLELVIGGDGVDILFCNSDEATDYGHGDLHQGIIELKKKTDLLVVTRGKEGAILFPKNQEHIDLEPFAVEAVDTTGAGDTFAGAFLYGLSQQYSLTKSGILANKTAAKCVSQFGPRLSKAQQTEILNEIETSTIE